MRILRKIVKYIFIAFIIVLSVDVILVVGVAHWRPKIKHADAIIILGAAINTPALHDRTTEALRLYNEGKGGVLVLSGGKIKESDVSEAGYMQKVIKKNANPLPPVILEEQSHNTQDNIKNSRAKVPDAKSAIIVSDEFHLARAVLIAYRNGLYPVYWSSPKPDYYSKAELNRYYLREMVAIVAYIPKFVFNK